MNFIGAVKVAAIDNAHISLQFEYRAIPWNHQAQSQPQQKIKTNINMVGESM